MKSKTAKPSATFEELLLKLIACLPLSSFTNENEAAELYAQLERLVKKSKNKSA